MRGELRSPAGCGVELIARPLQPGIARTAAARIAAMSQLWRKRRRDRCELAALDDRALRDIGLTRGDVEFEINKPFWRA